ncbi:hypothetical protein C8R44DRAFT_751045 [Mycena epipterygia]|nr:hypothetical protein C8R44DRAFT_751045 [Mycena epipterygia]
MYREFERRLEADEKKKVLVEALCTRARTERATICNRRADNHYQGRQRRNHPLLDPYSGGGYFNLMASLHSELSRRSEYEQAAVRKGQEITHESSDTVNGKKCETFVPDALLLDKLAPRSIHIPPPPVRIPDPRNMLVVDGADSKLLRLILTLPHALPAQVQNPA